MTPFAPMLERPSQAAPGLPPAPYLSARVPRYTSYPTAPHFRPVADDSAARAWLAALPGTAHLSLYLHVPFCKQMCWYCGCNMKLAARHAPVSAYAERLAAEIDLAADAIGRRLTVTRIHWGGGTPTILSPADFAAVDARLRRRFDIAPGAEIAVEVDPRTLTEATVGALASMGVTRASLGVQEFDPAVQQAVNRIQPFDMVARAVGWLRGAGITAINFDLIYGLPHQSEATLLDSIAMALRLRPDRIALFGYAHVPWMAKNQRLIPEDALPGPGARFSMAERAGAALLAGGYQPIGIDHFALPHDPLAVAARTGHLARNFQGYTDDTSDALIGLGASAISALPQGYLQNHTETGVHARAVSAGRLPTAKALPLDHDDVWRRAVIERIMCDFRVDLGAVAATHDLPGSAMADDLLRLAPLVTDGLVVLDGPVLELTPRGQALARVVAAAFDAYLHRPAQTARHATV